MKKITIIVLSLFIFTSLYAGEIQYPENFKPVLIHKDKYSKSKSILGVICVEKKNKKCQSVQIRELFFRGNGKLYRSYNQSTVIGRSKWKNYIKKLAVKISSSVEAGDFIAVTGIMGYISYALVTKAKIPFRPLGLVTAAAIPGAVVLDVIKAPILGLTFLGDSISNRIKKYRVKRRLKKFFTKKKSYKPVKVNEDVFNSYKVQFSRTSEALTK